MAFSGTLTVGKNCCFNYSWLTGQCQLVKSFTWTKSDLGSGSDSGPGSGSGSGLGSGSGSGSDLGSDSRYV